MPKPFRVLEDGQAAWLPTALQIRSLQAAPATGRRTAECRRKPASFPLAGTHHFPDFSFHDVALQRADVADVKPALQVLGFVQEGAGQKSLADCLEPLALEILSADGDHVGPSHGLAELRQAETSFAAALF